MTHHQLLAFLALERVPEAPLEQLAEDVKIDLSYFNVAVAALEQGKWNASQEPAQVTQYDEPGPRDDDFSFENYLQEEINSRLAQPEKIPQFQMRKIAKQCEYRQEVADAIVAIMSHYEYEKGAIVSPTKFVLKLIRESSLTELLKEAGLYQGAPDDLSPGDRVLDTVLATTGVKREEDYIDWDAIERDKAYLGASSG